MRIGRSLTNSDATGHPCRRGFQLWTCNVLPIGSERSVERRAACRGFRRRCKACPRSATGDDDGARSPWSLDGSKGVGNDVEWGGGASALGTLHGRTMGLDAPRLRVPPGESAGGTARFVAVRVVELGHVHGQPRACRRTVSGANDAQPRSRYGHAGRISAALAKRRDVSGFGPARPSTPARLPYGIGGAL